MKPYARRGSVMLICHEIRINVSYQRGFLPNGSPMARRDFSIVLITGSDVCESVSPNPILKLRLYGSVYTSSRLESNVQLDDLMIQRARSTYLLEQGSKVGGHLQLQKSISMLHQRIRHSHTTITRSSGPLNGENGEDCTLTPQRLIASSRRGQKK